MGKILIIIITNSPIVGQRGFKYDIAKVTLDVCDGQRDGEKHTRLVQP